MGPLLYPLAPWHPSPFTPPCYSLHPTLLLPSPHSLPLLLHSLLPPLLPPRAPPSLLWNSLTLYTERVEHI